MSSSSSLDVDLIALCLAMHLVGVEPLQDALNNHTHANNNKRKQPAGVAAIAGGERSPSNDSDNDESYYKFYWESPLLVDVNPRSLVVSLSLLSLHPPPPMPQQQQQQAEENEVVEVAVSVHVTFHLHLDPPLEQQQEGKPWIQLEWGLLTMTNPTTTSTATTATNNSGGKYYRFLQTRKDEENMMEQHFRNITAPPKELARYMANTLKSMSSSSNSNNNSSKKNGSSSRKVFLVHKQMNEEDGGSRGRRGGGVYIRLPYQYGSGDLCFGGSTSSNNNSEEEVVEEEEPLSSSSSSASCSHLDPHVLELWIRSRSCCSATTTAAPTTATDDDTAIEKAIDSVCARWKECKEQWLQRRLQHQPTVLQQPLPQQSAAATAASSSAPGVQNSNTNTSANGNDNNNPKKPNVNTKRPIARAFVRKNKKVKKAGL